MEGDDGAVACVPVHLAEYLAAIKLGIVVARHEIPHDDAVALAERTVLPHAHDAVRRPEEIGGEVAIGLVDIGDVVGCALLESLEMVVGMVAYAMPALDNHLVLIGVLAHIVAHHEEGGLDAVSVEHIKHPRGNLRDGAVIKSEVDGLF